MENDDGVRKLVDIVFGTTTSIHKEVEAGNSPIPACLLSTDFSKKMLDVLFLRKFIVSGECREKFHSIRRLLLSSHESYFKHVITMCLSDYLYHRNIFESFISVCAIVANLSYETLEKAGVNFLDFNPDIIMVLYGRVLKGPFNEQGGLHRFVEYIHGHRYLKWKWNRNDLISIAAPSSPLSTNPDLNNNLSKDNLVLYQGVTMSSNMIDQTMGEVTKLTATVLETTSAQLPTLPNEYDLIARLVASGKREKAKIAESKKKATAASTSKTLNRAVQGHSSLNSESETKNTEKQKDNAEYCENIIQAVIRHNHSKNPGGHKNGNDKVLKETEEILEHLEKTIKSLIEVLDKSDER